MAEERDTDEPATVVEADNGGGGILAVILMIIVVLILLFLFRDQLGLGSEEISIPDKIEVNVS